LILIISVSGIGLASDYIQFSPDESGLQTGLHIKLMTYNLHMYYQEEPDSLLEKTGSYTFDNVLKVIQAVKPDILGIQETEGNRASSANQNGVEWLSNKLDMYYFYGPQTAEQIFGVSILSRWPIISQKAIILPATQSIERAAILVVIDTPTGKLNVLVTHIQTPSYKEDQFVQVSEVIKICQGLDRLILLGDFNIEPNSDDRSFDLINNSYLDSWVSAGNDPNDPKGYTAPVTDPEKRIDYIWLSRDDWSVVQGTEVVSGNPAASDHLAYSIVVTLVN
jgi:endonuclease/exonuclease/phosphatase family metal-dependent hydrolase